MIPHIIHYCWFGGKPLPPLALKCIESWRRFFPDYEIKEWNESNFDVNVIPYTKEAYEAHKFAFVSDYARFYILYNYGGIYFDVDVEVIKSMDEIISKGAFMGCEACSSISIAPGLGIGASEGLSIYRDFLNKYANLHFRNSDGSLNQKTVVQYATELFRTKGLRESKEVQLVEGINIYPAEYFCPINYYTKEKRITPNTYSIHHYAESWVDTRIRIYEFCNRHLGIENTRRIAKLLKSLNL